MKTFMTQELRILAAMALIGATPMALGQDDPLLADTEEILNSEQINIDGTFRKQTAADRIEKMRKRLENQNEQMVQKKIEDIRINQEKQLAGKLQKAFRGNMQAMDDMDSVQTVQAAPQRIVAPAPIIEEKKELKNKIIPYFGVRQYNGENIDSFESKVNAGLTMENMITDHFSIGLGVNYTTMDITDRNSFVGFNSFGYNDGDNISYQNINLNLNGKFFMTKDSTIRPYVGLGLGYNRTSMKYNEENSQFNQGFGTNFGNTQNNEESKVSGSNVSGSGMIGAEVSFTENLGLNLEFNYTRAITSAFDGTQNLGFGGFNDVAKANLRTLGDNLEDSDIASLNLGFVIKF